MDHQPIDQLARSLARAKPRRWTVKAFAAGLVSVGLLTHGTRFSEARARNSFVKCLESCLALCEKQHNCRITEKDCAASCSNAEL
ncbi:MAG TPA: hypothetical protein VFQ80_04470 [Thermomicrobiales bacterium]|jgi:hypothetical protein|nr:hypothetical protein [Thermomicrobiales bacterium]